MNLRPHSSSQHSLHTWQGAACIPVETSEQTTFQLLEPILLRNTPWKIGSEDTNHYVLRSEDIAPHHASIVIEQSGRAFLHNTSAAYVACNGVPVDTSFEIFHGDFIHCGRHSFRFVKQSEKPFEPEPILIPITKQTDPTSVEVRHIEKPDAAPSLSSSAIRITPVRLTMILIAFACCVIGYLLWKQREQVDAIEKAEQALAADDPQTTLDRLHDFKTSLSLASKREILITQATLCKKIRDVLDAKNRDSFHTLSLTELAPTSCPQLQKRWQIEKQKHTTTAIQVFNNSPHRSVVQDIDSLIVDTSFAYKGRPLIQTSASIVNLFQNNQVEKARMLAAQQSQTDYLLNLADFESRLSEGKAWLKEGNPDRALLALGDAYSLYFALGGLRLGTLYHETYSALMSSLIASARFHHARGNYCTAAQRLFFAQKETLLVKDQSLRLPAVETLIQQYETQAMNEIKRIEIVETQEPDRAKILAQNALCLCLPGTTCYQTLRQKASFALSSPSP